MLRDHFPFIAYLIAVAMLSPIWFLALASHGAGNPTAINALVGIPLALIVTGIPVMLTELVPLVQDFMDCCEDRRLRRKRSEV